MTISFTYKKPQTIVVGIKELDIYHQYPIPIFNITSIDNPYNTTITGGLVLISTLPEGLDLFNREVGLVGKLNISTSGLTIFAQIDLESNLRRAGISISGSRTIIGSN